MTKAARLVLEDAKYAINRHSDDLQGAAFRVSWFSVLALLRAVGHVLAKVDSEASSAMKKAVQTKWQELQSETPPIWRFIENDRNNFLKEYQSGVMRTRSRLATLPNGKTFYVALDAGNVRGGMVASMDKSDSVIKEGPFKGQHEKAVALEAYEWWLAYLDAVDRLADSL